MALDKFTDSFYRLKAFYLLIALAGDKNLEVAKKAYHRFNYEDEYECVYNFSGNKVDVLHLVSDKDVFRQNLKNIMTDIDELLLEID